MRKLEDEYEKLQSKAIFTSEQQELKYKKLNKIRDKIDKITAL